MNIENAKDIIQKNERVIFYFGKNHALYCEYIDKFKGYGKPNGYDTANECCLLFLNGKFYGFNRVESIGFFKMNFKDKVAYYNRYADGENADKEWLLVDLSKRSAKVV